AENVEAIFADYDLIIDGSDNFPTRYLVNDACIKLGLPNIYGAVQGFEGQVSVFAANGQPCYRCLFAEPPPPELAPSCSQAGVLGVVPGIIGLLQALEAIKIITGIGEPLIGRLLLFDGRTSRLREVRPQADPNCAYCAPGQTFPGYADYQHFCQSAKE
ncbi:MAG: ThiF family adenylyltransferase, partial [Wenzhouxiangella sp.]|nr:ThiF family adenylyltransferase [Wenzhouxiangella sp.]